LHHPPWRTFLGQAVAALRDKHPIVRQSVDLSAHGFEDLAEQARLIGRDFGPACVRQAAKRDKEAKFTALFLHEYQRAA
jgi:hypothetical protein